MTDALTRLADAVEAGTATSADFRAAFPAGNGHDSGAILAAYHGSLDAAKSLHEAVLTIHSWDVWRVSAFDGDPRKYGCNIATVDTTFAETPARAWLLAILRALAQVQG